MILHVSPTVIPRIIFQSFSNVLKCYRYISTGRLLIGSFKYWPSGRSLRVGEIHLPSTPGEICVRDVRVCVMEICVCVYDVCKYVKCVSVCT